MPICLRMSQSTLPRPWTQRVYQHPLLDGTALNFFLESLNPSWSLLEPCAKVLEIRQETHDTRSFVLQPGWGWTRFKAGQHVGVAVEINGVTYRRRYSISSAPQARSGAPFSITVKREPGGRISNFLHDHIAVGARLKLALPAGDFVLPEPAPDRLLMLAAGSGITPIMSQLRQLLRSDFSGSIELLAYVRSAQDRIFEQDLQSLQAAHPQLRVQWCEESSNQERFSAGQIQRRVPDYALRHTLLCGPSGFMAAVRQHWDAQALNAQLQFEYFGSPQPLQPVNKGAGVAAQIQLQRSGRHIDVQAGQAALLALEAAGETPAYGCRMGICQSCKCTKLSGQVRNLVTGQISREPNEDIQLCVSVAQTDLVLDY